MLCYTLYYDFKKVLKHLNNYSVPRLPLHRGSKEYIYWLHDRGKIFIIFIIFMFFYFFLFPEPQKISYISQYAVYNTVALCKKLTSETVFELIPREQSISSRSNVSILLV